MFAALALSVFGWFVIPGFLVALILLAFVVICAVVDEGSFTTWFVLIAGALLYFLVKPEWSWGFIGLVVAVYLVLGGIYILARYSIKAKTAKENLADQKISLEEYNLKARIHNAELIAYVESMRNTSYSSETGENHTKIITDIKAAREKLHDMHASIVDKYGKKGIPLSNTEVDRASDFTIWGKNYEYDAVKEGLCFDPIKMNKPKVTYQYFYWPLDLLHELIEEYFEKIIKYPMELAKKLLALSVNRIIRS